MVLTGAYYGIMKTKKHRAENMPTAPKATAEELAEQTILLTPSGSHLYGLNHAGSDEDYYRVVPDDFYWKAIGSFPSGKPKMLIAQHISNGIDELTVSEKTFAILALKGAPQTLEAMFSQQATIDRLEAFRKDYFAGMGPDSMIERYRQTIHTFIYGNFKSRRHALRLSLNLNESMINGGRFNPTLTPEQVKFISDLASSSPEEYIKGLTDLNHYEISDEFNMEELAQNFAQDT
jgi:hypothetical protein